MRRHRPKIAAFRRASIAQEGFSLLELLLVLALIAILTAIAVPAINSIQSSYALEAAGQQISAQLNSARQYALTTNRPVQVRFYKIADYKNSGTQVYRAMQSFVESESAVTPIDKPFFFPPTITIAQTSSNGTDVSNLFTTAYSGITVVTSADSSNPLPPPYGTAYQYAYFHFRTNGQTDLSSSTSVNLLLTLAQETAPLTSNGLPSNYVTLQLNAITGIVSTYRP